MPNSTTVAGQTALTRSQRKDSRCHITATIFPGMPMLCIGSRQFPISFAEGDINTFNKKFIAILEDIRLDVQHKGIDLNNYQHDYLTQFRDLGKAAYNKILPAAAREYLKNKEQEEQKRGLSLTFRTPFTFSFFWEMLYAGKPFGFEKEQFWGFHYPIGRTYWGEMEFPDRIRLQQGIFSAIHHKLKYSRQEIKQIKQHLSQACEILKLQLTFELLEQHLPAQSLCIEALVELFHDENFKYGIIHFACHCLNSLQANISEAYLSLTVHEEKLEIELEKLLVWEDYGFQNHPFVFLNACESATPGKLLQTLSFPTEMLNFGAAGVIATACIIPDNFASAFASKFYELLFSKLSMDVPVNIGEVLLETRLFFLKEYNNPLGLAYGLYALSNQQLRLTE
ncbi:MAG: CHAT domain-containing protein [Symploca sp. SIO3C6]|nr:CHAT domain-containing protein [Symploca sp. SIO3C6]